MLPTLIFVGFGLGLGIAMVQLNLTQYEVLFSTLNMGFAASILWKQHFPKKNSMQKKSWKITGGLVEGYSGNGAEHSLHEVKTIFMLWMETRFAQDKFFVCGGMKETCIGYITRNGKPEENGKALAEKSFELDGELLPKYDANRSDEEVEEALIHLATELMLKLKQTRIYYSYLGKQNHIDRSQIKQC